MAIHAIHNLKWSTFDDASIVARTQFSFFMLSSTGVYLFRTFFCLPPALFSFLDWANPQDSPILLLFNARSARLGDHFTSDTQFLTDPATSSVFERMTHSLANSHQHFSHFNGNIIITKIN